MYKLALILGAAATLVSAAAMPEAAQAHHRHYYHHARYGSGCQRAERRSGTGGAVVGGVGALAGHKLGQDAHNC